MAGYSKPDGGHSALEHFQCSKFFFFVSLPQICSWLRACLWALKAVPLTSGLGFSSDPLHRCVSSHITLVYHRWTHMEVLKHLRDDQVKWKNPAADVRAKMLGTSVKAIFPSSFLITKTRKLLSFWGFEWTFMFLLAQRSDFCPVNKWNFFNILFCVELVFNL